MKIADLFYSFQTQEQAVEYLEKVRWRGHPICPYCRSEKISRHASGDRKGQRWQCQKCTRSFSVTVGTIFHGTHVPLRDWFLLLALMLNAKKSASAYQIARDLGMRRPTVWSMMHRVRLAMATDRDQAELLSGIVEADETYIGGKPRKPNQHGGEKTGRGAKRGRGTTKSAVIGVVERGGRIIARPAKPKELGSKGLTRFLRNHVAPEGRLVVTDEWQGYSRVSEHMLHATINHAAEYSNRMIHTNTIESFWGMLKRAWYGTHYFYSKKYMNLYIAEACYKFNYRKLPETFDHMIGVMVNA